MVNNHFFPSTTHKKIVSIILLGGLFRQHLKKALFVTWGQNTHNSNQHELSIKYVGFFKTKKTSVSPFLFCNRWGKNNTRVLISHEKSQNAKAEMHVGPLVQWANSYKAFLLIELASYCKLFTFSASLLFKTWRFVSHWRLCVFSTFKSGQTHKSNRWHLVLQ